MCSQAEGETSIEIQWCNSCRVPIIYPTDTIEKKFCPVCQSSIKYLAADVRPVFPEERLLLATLLKKDPSELMNISIWAANNQYYFDGESVKLPKDIFKVTDVVKITAEISKYQKLIDYKFFDENIANFVRANIYRLNYLKNEAATFIKCAAQNYPAENIIISFSGGKDSTVTADLVKKSLSNPYLVHIFGDTTLEFPTTTEYAKRYRTENPMAIFQTAKNYEQIFLEVCKDIGPPSRMMRWCCLMFKTGPISRVITGLYGSQNVLTFYGIRKSESVSRSKYNRFEKNSAGLKIRQQAVASPIFFWSTAEVWLYILAENLDFNEAYRQGYDRVGCWCCPNNNTRDQFLSKIYMAEKSDRWRKFLIEFAKSIGKPDPENYVDGGKWKARQGGNGLKSAADVKIRFTNCTSEENAQIYKLVRPFDDALINLFVPFGKIAPALGNKLLNETVILDLKTNMPIISIQPFNQAKYEYAAKIKILNVADAEKLWRMINYQIRKFNACRQCLKCESLCRVGAISVSANGYYINPEKCIHCKICITPKYINGGCMMENYLRTK